MRSFNPPYAELFLFDLVKNYLLNFIYQEESERFLLTNN